jgi:tetratricopeptide (TPR) repeat protein
MSAFLPRHLLRAPSVANLGLIFGFGFWLISGFAFFIALPSTPMAQTAKPVQLDLIGRGNQLYEKGDYVAAADLYRQAALTSRQSLQKAFAWFNLGNCHVQTKAYQKAIVAYRRSVEVAPTFSRAWSVMGDVYFTLEAIGEATMCYRRVLENEGADFHAHQMLGECALKANDVTEALRHFDAAAKIEPEAADLYLAQSEALARLRDYEAAQQVMEQAILRLAKPPADAFFYLGQLYELDGKPRKAVRAYEEGLAYAPKRKDYWYRIANLHQREKDDFLALLTFEQAIAAGHRDSEMFLRRGLIFFDQRRLDKALEEFKAARALGSLQARRGIENVAAAYANLGDKKKADEARRLITQ